MISTLMIGIAGIGLALLLVLYFRIRAVDGHLKLKKHRAKSAGMADLLKYAAVVDDGVIVGKDGSFMASWLYQGEDSANSTDEQRNVVSFRLNQAFARMGNGWMIHVDAVRRPSANYSAPERSKFPDRVSEAIDEERRRYFEGLGTMHEGYFVLTVTYFPPALAEQKFVELMFDDETKAAGHLERTMGLIETFKRDCDQIEANLSQALRMHRLKGHQVVNEDGTKTTHDDLLRWLQFCTTGQNHPMILPTNPMYLDALLGGQDLLSGVVPRIGRKYVQVVAIEGFPLESYPGVLNALGEQPSEYRWSNRFIFLDQHEAEKHLDKYRKKWKQKLRGFFDQVFNTNTSGVDQDAQAMVSDAEAAIAESKSGVVAHGYYTSVVVLMDESRQRLEAAARQIDQAIKGLGFASRVETINTMDAFMGSLPGHGVENVRRPLLNTMNLADLLPTSTIWTGEETAPCPMYPPEAPALMHCVTTGQSLFRLNLHVRDLGHAFLFGPTRAGKSTKLGIMAAQFRRYEGARIFAFDKGMSMYPVCMALGGRHYNVADADDKLSFCPLQFIASRADRAWAMEWVDSILELNDVHTDASMRNEIGNAIVNLHDSRLDQPTAKPATMSELSVMIQDERIREALKQYTVEGLMGHLLDAERDGLALSDFTVFEVEELMGLGEKFALPVLLYLFRRIELALDGRPTILFIDEAWLMLAHPIFREKIREWLKTWAKKNCSVVLATQNVSDAAKSGILDVIVESTATKIFLPNIYARDEETSATYMRMGCNKRQIEILASAVPKRDYYYMSELGRRLYSLALGPLALSFVGATDKESIATIKGLVAKYGRDAWVDEWLRSRGVSMQDYRRAA